MGAGERESARRSGRQLTIAVAASLLTVFALGAGGAALSGWVGEHSSSDLERFALLAGFGALAAIALLPISLRLGRAVSGAPRRGRPRVLRGVRRAIERGELELHFQPQLEILSGRVHGVEALVRWRHRGELLAPGAFLGDIEASGLIGRLTDHVLSLALSQAGEWHGAGLPIRLAVNLSAANLREATTARQLDRHLTAQGVDPALVTVEVTETAVLENPERTRVVLDAIKALGVSISVDDFGTGYSSLLWLRLFPVDEVKIERSFVSEVEGEGEAYVSGVIRLAHDLGLTVVAEGIEDKATLRRLQELGCDVGQGYLFAEPLPASAVAGWVGKRAEGHWDRQRRELSLGTVDALGDARRLIQETAAAAGFGPAAIWEMKLAATEALASAITARPSEGEEVILRLSRERDDMRLEIRGTHAGTRTTNGTEDTDRARGVAIMSALMDELELHRSADDTLIRLSKRLGNGEARI